jgi:hypothetical protein
MLVLLLRLRCTERACRVSLDGCASSAEGSGTTTCGGAEGPLRRVRVSGESARDGERCVSLLQTVFGTSRCASFMLRREEGVSGHGADRFSHACVQTIPPRPPRLVHLFFSSLNGRFAARPACGTRSLPVPSSPLTGSLPSEMGKSTTRKNQNKIPRETERECRE